MGAPETRVAQQAAAPVIRLHIRAAGWCRIRLRLRVRCVATAIAPFSRSRIDILVVRWLAIWRRISCAIIDDELACVAEVLAWICFGAAISPAPFRAAIAPHVFSMTVELDIVAAVAYFRTGSANSVVHIRNTLVDARAAYVGILRRIAVRVRAHVQAFLCLFRHSDQVADRCCYWRCC